MVISELRALHFRNYAELQVTLSPTFTLLVGQNGQGKTNLAEALYFLCNLASFRTHQSARLIEQGQPAAWLQGTFVHKDSEQVARMELTRRGRRVWLDGDPVLRHSDYAATSLALAFNPDGLYRYRHVPNDRRSFYNRFFSFLDPIYLEALRDFRGVLAQKNRLLKGQRLASLPDWNQLFMEKACAIIKKRRETVAAMAETLTERFRALTGREEILRLGYRPSLPEAPAEALAALEQAREGEHRAGHALLGPHRDDFALSLQPGRGESYFSQGEYRSAYLALLLALNHLLAERLAFRPLIILDDLFSELDPQVRERLLRHLHALPNQIVVTTTDLSHLVPPRDARIMEIQAGRII